MTPRSLLRHVLLENFASRLGNNQVKLGLKLEIEVVLRPNVSNTELS